MVTIDTTQIVRPVDSRLLGVNLAWWDGTLNTPRTQQLIQTTGLNLFRFPGGSSSDTWHFNVGPTYNGEGTSPSMANFIASVNSDGMVTLNYGTGSPQEAAAFVAYINGDVGNTTVIGHGPQWSDTTHSWVDKDWLTADYWAGLRAATPVTPDDGLNFLRIGREQPFGFSYFEIGNEIYGNWETDHHTIPHDPATYVQFTRTFTDLARSIAPNISIGLNGSGTGGSFSQIPGNWTRQMLDQCAQQGVLPEFISDHNYMYNPGNEDDARLLLHTATDPNATSYGGPINWAGRAQAYRALITQYLGDAGSYVQLFTTEFNSVSSNDSNQTTSLVNGLWLADAMGGLLQTEYNAAVVWDLRNGYNTSHYNPNLYGWRQGGDYGLLGSGSGPAPATGAYVPYPTWFAVQLLSQVIQDGGVVVQASSDDPTLATYAVQEPDGHLDLLVINKNPGTDLNADFQVAGFTPDGNATVWQYGKAEDNAQSQTSDGSSSLTTFTTTLPIVGSSFSYSFPQYSMTVLDLEPDSSPGGRASPPHSGREQADPWTARGAGSDIWNNAGLFLLEASTPAGEGHGPLQPDRDASRTAGPPFQVDPSGEQTVQTIPARGSIASRDGLHESASDPGAIEGFNSFARAYPADGVPDTAGPFSPPSVSP
jgi:hypothetical protein